MGMMTGQRPVVEAAERTNGEEQGEVQQAAKAAQDTAERPGRTLIRPNQPPAPEPAGQAVDQTARTGTDVHAGFLAQFGPTDTAVKTDAAVKTDDQIAVIPVEPGYVGTAPPCSTITVGTDSLETSAQMDVNWGVVGVTGASTTVKNSVGPVSIDVGSTATSLTKCYEGSAVTRAGTRLTATSSPIILTQYEDNAVLVQLVSGSLSVTGAGPHTAQVTTPPRHVAIATVGAAGASVTNIKGAASIAMATPAPSSSSSGRHRRRED